MTLRYISAALLAGIAAMLVACASVQEEVEQEVPQITVAQESLPTAVSGGPMGPGKIPVSSTSRTPYPPGLASSSSFTPSPSPTPTNAEGEATVDEAGYSLFTSEIRALIRPNDKMPFALEDMTIDSFAYGTPMRRVLRKYGEPQEHLEHEDWRDGQLYEDHLYVNGNAFSYMVYDDGEKALAAVSIVSEDSVGPRGIRVGDSMEKVINAFLVKPPIDEVPVEFRDEEWQYTPADSYTELYADVFIYSLEEAMEYLDEKGPVYRAIRPEGYLWADVIPEGAQEAFAVNYVTPVEPYTREMVLEHDTPYYPHAYVYFYCTDRVVTRIEWYIYAAD